MSERTWYGSRKKPATHIVTDPLPKLEGVHGWLAWFIAAQVVGIGFSIYWLFQAEPDIWAFVQFLEIAGMAFALAMLIWTREKFAVHITQAVLLLEVVLGFFMIQGNTSEAWADTVFRSMIVSTIWLIYFVRSKRVANTYGYANHH